MEWKYRREGVVEGIVGGEEVCIVVVCDKAKFKKGRREVSRSMRFL